MITIIRWRNWILLGSLALCAVGLAWLRLLDKAAERLDLKIKPIGEAP